ncbi:MAG: hypothetical protein KDH94_07295, partial [Coxiellaceae bacterium]|nr:hypothetical protein [Coxiellaceae bacterium]
FYPNLMRNHVDDSNELSRISVVISDQTDLNQKCTVLMGVEGEVDSFPVVLLSADLQEGSKGFEAKGAVFYYQLFSYFICQVMQDEYSIGDHDGLRGRVIARFLRALSELSLKDEGIAHVQDRERAARNLAYFFCRSLCDSDAGPDVVSRYVIDLLAAWNQPLLQGAVQSNFYDQGAFSVMLPRLLNSLVLARSDDATTLLFQLLFDLHQEEHQVLVKNFLGRSRGIVEIFAKFNGHQFHRFLEKMKADIRASHIEPAFYCLVNCLWGLHIVQRPRLAWQLIDVLQLALVNKYPGHSINSLCAVFDFSGFAEIASREPLQLKSYDARFQIMNPMLMHLLTLVDEDSQNLFINFIDSCRDEDVKHHLVIFKPVLPINNQNALERFASWIGQKCANRVVAMLIFALHSPEYFASHRRSPGFYQEPPLLVAEVQTILCSFNKPTNLNHNSNREIIDYLLHFEFNKAKLEQLKEATNSLYLNIPTTESFGY